MSRTTKELLLAAVEVIDREIGRYQKSKTKLDEVEALKLCRYTTVLHRLMKVEDDIAPDEFGDIRQDKLDALIDELIELKVKKNRTRRKRKCKTG